jgi:hypothetical protein
MIIKTYQDEPNESYNVYQTPDCNLVNPVHYFSKSMEDLNYHMSMSSLQAFPDYELLKSKSRIELSQRFKSMAKQQCNKELKRILDCEPPSIVLQLLQEKKKKAQQKLIKDMVFSTDLLQGLPIHAWYKYKMPFSRLTVNYYAKELANKVYPLLMYKDDSGEFKCIGHTDLSAAEMQVALDKRHRVISDFIGDEEHWLCFFRTQSGIKGKEAPHIGQPHIHYISSAWGISRADVIGNLSSYRYSLKAETIPFEPKHQ